MNDFLLLELPVFSPKYKKWKKYGYENPKERENAKEVLREASEGYCMYCYSHVYVDGKFFGHLEHAIEKNHSKKLLECIPNIGLSCPVCNQSFKRVGERSRKLLTEQIREFECTSKCGVEKRKQCTIPCKALRKLQEDYSQLEGAGILLQPMGVFGEQTGERLELQYDVLKMEFQPAEKSHTYSEKEKSFIYEHIKRFHLNDPQFRSRKLFEFIKDVIDHDGFMQSGGYENMIVAVFANQLKGKTKEEILKICSRIYIAVFPKMQ